MQKKRVESAEADAPDLIEYAPQIHKGAWIMLRKLLPISVSPPPLSVHWAVPWPLERHWYKSELGGFVSRSGDDKWTNKHQQPTREEFEAALGSSDTMLDIFSETPIGRMKMIFNSEAIGIWKHEFFLPSVDLITMCMEENKFTRHPLDTVLQMPSTEVTDPLVRELRDAALTEGADMLQAENLALGGQPDEVLISAVLPKGFWYEMSEDVRNVFGL